MYSNPMVSRHASAAKAASGETFVKKVAWTTAVLTLIGVAWLIAWLVPPMLRGREAAWKESFAAAEGAREGGDRYRALEMYIRSARIAESADDWRGELAIACGLQKLGKTEGPSLYGFNVLVAAMGSAERQKSTEGMRAVADAFTSLGTSYASFALSQVQDDWLESGAARVALADQRKSAAAQIGGC